MNGLAVFMLFAVLLLCLSEKTAAYNSYQGMPSHISLRYRKDSGYVARPPFKGYIDPQYNPVIRFRRNFLPASGPNIDNFNGAAEHYVELRQQLL